MISRTLKLATQNPARAWLVLRMSAWVVILSGLVKVCSLPRALRFVSTKVRPEHTGKPRDREELSTAIDSVLGMNFFVFKPNCWKRATVLHRYLALAGVKTTIVFGLRKETGGELKGHAWLEAAGQPILESALPVYKVTYTFPSTEQFEVELALMAETRR